jgi:hypothetical protein
MRRMVKITPSAEVTVVDVPLFEDVVRHVGGLIDYAGVMDAPEYALIFNQDGATYHLPVNPLASLLLGQPWDRHAVLVGTVLVAPLEQDAGETGDGWGDDPDIAVHVLQLVAQKVKAAMLQ